MQQESDAQYLLGHSEQELERLRAQARLYKPFTAQFFHDSGLTLGMRVLDVGCGTGDVSFLAARLIGLSGQVLGVDRSAVAVAAASRMAQTLNLPNARFVVGDAGKMAFDAPFDAVVGRFVLMHNPEPIALLRQLVTQVRSGGVVAFQEADWTGYRSHPRLPTWDQCARWIIAAHEGAGSDAMFGLKLVEAFTTAGLPCPSLSVHASVAAGPDHPLYTHAAELVRSLLPTLERLGIVNADEVAVDTLASRLRDEVVTSNGMVVWVSVMGAASRKASQR